MCTYCNIDSDFFLFEKTSFSRCRHTFPRFLLISSVTSNRQLLLHLSTQNTQEYLAPRSGIHCRLSSVCVFPGKLLVRVDTNKIKLLYPHTQTLTLSHTTSLETQTELLPQPVWAPGSLLSYFCWQRLTHEPWCGWKGASESRLQSSGWLVAQYKLS